MCAKNHHHTQTTNERELALCSSWGHTSHQLNHLVVIFSGEIVWLMTIANAIFPHQACQHSNSSNDTLSPEEIQSQHVKEKKRDNISPANKEMPFMPTNINLPKFNMMSACQPVQSICPEIACSLSSFFLLALQFLFSLQHLVWCGAPITALQCWHCIFLLPQFQDQHLFCC